jgi:adenylate cyclase
LCRFLRYIVAETLAGRASGIKEQVLGLEVFDRGPDFNPRLDPIVRVQARNLRSRMAKYYEGPGQSDPIRIELPKGTYVPLFHQVGPVAPTLAVGAAQVAAEDTAPASRSAMPAPPPRSPVAVRRQVLPRFVVASAILVVILAGIAVLWVSRTLASQGAGADSRKRQSGMIMLRHSNAAVMRETSHFRSLLGEMHFEG